MIDARAITMEARVAATAVVVCPCAKRRRQNACATFRSAFTNDIGATSWIQIVKISDDTPATDCSEPQHGFNQ